MVAAPTDCIASGARGAGVALGGVGVDGEAEAAAAPAPHAVLFPDAKPAVTHAVVSELNWMLLPGGCVTVMLAPVGAGAGLGVELAAGVGVAGVPGAAGGVARPVNAAATSVAVR